MLVTATTRVLLPLLPPTAYYAVPSYRTPYPNDSDFRIGGHAKVSEHQQELVAAVTGAVSGSTGS